ncbi:MULTISPECIES: glycoside hydrolase family 3 N-terminal domain-containing protein [unclassified Campylobacter]|uniref:glycoside hydrolase family 3 N-terminal domain-containing protein n=1 Tax=unclassified Campylobacter TaxID=2593542 RepID=UPI0020165EE4|nr:MULTISPECIES: glycoside hydrolase family 3 N-terminal domain-containing protein [unclassified Campylobacter]
MKKILNLFLCFTFFSCISFAEERPTLRKMIAQMIMVGFNGSSLNDTMSVVSDAKYQRFGGVIVFGKNISTKDNLKKITSALKSAQSGIFIAIDEEGGNVTRFNDKKGFNTFISASEVAKTLDLNGANELYKKMAKQLKDLGVNLNFAPVVDLLNTNSPIIASKNRAFSKNIDEVSLYANEFLDAFSEVGVLTTLKHFPGHGSAKTDSHIEKTVIENFDYSELKPYYDAIKRDKSKLIMISHIYLLDRDTQFPASMSNDIIGSLLRKDLKFDGVVISDDMLMGGLKGFSMTQKVVNFINAGGDILLFSEFMIGERRTSEYITQVIVDAVNSKKIKKERIEESYDRIIKLKSELK